MFEDGKT